jgi:N-acetylglucosamine-6-sulfatase
MRRTVVLLASMALAVVLLFSVTPYSEPAAAQASPGKPNFVYILADDMRKDDLEYMPKTRRLLGSQGRTFENAYVPLGLCCPSRASILTGMYTHNHEVWDNNNGPNGGWEGFRRQGHERDNMATRMRAAGYRTGLLGKYLNGYDGSRVPDGWSDWFAKFNGLYFDWHANDNGVKRHYGTDKNDYATDVLSRQTRQFIDQSVNTGKPFMAYVAPSAPKGDPATPAPRHRDAFNGEKAPRLLSFNEADVSDKPSFVQRPPLSAAEIDAIDKRHENRVESLQALDDLVKAVVNELGAEGVLNNTYVVFTSDNGWHHGEHRIPRAKATVYEESIHMPLLIRGPGVTPGSTTDKVALNIDVFPTFADLGRAVTPSYVDGRSLRPVLKGTATTWRTAFLLERGDPHSFFGIRTTEPRKYVEYEGGERELYDLSVSADPYELENSYDATTPPEDLALRLQVLKHCPTETTSCRQAEDGP